MLRKSQFPEGSSACRGRASWVVALLSGAALASGLMGAQPPPPVPAPEAPSTLPKVPLTSPRSLPEVRSFVEDLSRNDAVLEIVVGQARILTIRQDMKRPAVIALGDPTVVEFTVLNERQIRLLGERIGITDLSIVTTDNKVHNFEINVIADLDPLRLQLRATFPDATLKLSSFRDHVVVEGQARDTTQVNRIVEMIKDYLESVRINQATKVTFKELPPGLRPPFLARPAEVLPPPRGEPGKAEPAPVVPFPAAVTPEVNPLTRVESVVVSPRVINLIRVPGPQQVLLKVRIAELNRTAMRQMGSDFLAVDSGSGSIFGTQIGGATVNATGRISGMASAVGVPGSVVQSTVNVGQARALIGEASTAVSPLSTAFGIFQNANFELILSALRRNSFIRVLAEPNLVAMNGYQASFLAGGEFPVPVPQSGAAGGAAPAITVQFKEFGVRLGFVPFIQDDDVIRLTVDPEVSEIDRTTQATLVSGGSPVPGLTSRKAHTTVELRQGQTLAIAGLLQLTLDGNTARIPGLGDLPILGPFFSNTTSDRIEKELVVLITPYLVEPMNPDQVPPTPGDEVNTPNDLEFYLLNRIEGRTGRDFRATTEYDDALHVLRCFMKLEKNHVRGPHGYCEPAK